MRINRLLNAKRFQLWRAQSKKDWDELISKVSMASITTRGNESDDIVRGRMWALRGYFQSDEGKLVAKQQMDLFKTGVLTEH